MILAPDMKTDEKFGWVRDLSDQSFFGIQRPPHGILRAHFDQDDVFIRNQGYYPIGFAIVTEKLGEPYLWSIAVAKQLRGVGWGRKLLDEVHEFYAGKFSGISLACSIENPAQKLYFDAGYRVVRVLPRYYGEEGDGILMRRKLS